MKRLVAVVGPTGIGKTRLGIRLAREFGGEIISADSRQVYMRMDIGTAKPTPEERALVPHHLIDIIEPGDEFSLALYQGLAQQAIADVQKRGRLPILVGGSGLYVWAVLEGWQIPRAAPDPVLRRSLEQEAATDGGSRLYQELRRLDPDAAAGIDPRNVRRVIRALEVIRQTGERFSALKGRQPPPYESLVLGLTASRATVHRRTDARVEAMIGAGLVDEVRSLAETYGRDHPSMSGIGYGEIGLFLQGQLTLPEAVARIKVSTHRLVRKQYGWFRLKDERIRWFDVEQSDWENAAIAEVAGFLSGRR
jgi:tRNA dimethylallyltransferase